MNIAVTTESGIATIAPEGRLTAVAAPQLRQAVQRSIDAGTPRIVVDMAGTEFVDSSGLGALIGALKAARLAGGDLRIAAVPEAVRTVLRLTNLDRVLRAHDSAATAFDGD